MTHPSWVALHGMAHSFIELHNVVIHVFSLVVVVQSLSCVHAVCVPMDCSTPGFPVLHYLLSLLKLMCIESVMLPNHYITEYEQFVDMVSDSHISTNL